MGSLWNCRISFTGICLTCLMHNCKSESAQKCKVHCSFDLCPVQWSRNHKVRRQADWVEGMMPTAKKRRRTERPFAAVEARQSPPPPPPPPTSSATNPPINLSPMRLIHPHQLSFILYQNELNLWIEMFSMTSWLMSLEADLVTTFLVLNQVIPPISQILGHRWTWKNEK